MIHVKRAETNIFDTPISFTGNGKFWRSYEPFLDENYANVRSKPAQINRGLFKGYSFPIWNDAANVYEELVFRLRVPFRWDGVTNPYFCAITAISGNEDVDDTYKFQLEWASKDVGHVLPATADETISWEVSVIDGTAWRAEIIIGEMDASLDLVAGQNWQGRLRRITSSGDPVTNEPAVFHWCTRWLCDKFGTVSDMGYTG
ncbi:hypothetical protein KA005_60710 [bacterium]|nr:hypothetical protein [bacterium]